MGSDRYDKRFAKEINLKEIFTVLKKRFWVIVLFTLLAGAAGVAYNSINTPLLYQTSTNIIIGANSELMKTLHVIIKNPTVLGKVVEELDLEKSPEALAQQITVASVDDSQVVSIKVVDTDPNLAADIANTTAKVFKEEVPKIIEFNDVRFLSEAIINQTPINEKDNKKILIALIFGLIAGIGLAFLLDSFDDTVRSEAEIEDLLGLPVIGSVSKMNKKNIKKKSQNQMDLIVRGDSSVYK